MGESITKAIKKVFGIHSPSKLWREEIGQNLGISISLGFGDVMDDVKRDIAKDANGLTASMATEITANSTSGTLPSTSNTYNGGNVTINVYGAEGQSVSALADAVADRLEAMTARKGAVYA